MKVRIGAICLMAALSLLLTGLVVANGSASVDWHVIGSGGDHLESDGYTLDSTIGQAVVGAVEEDPYDVCAGYWCGAAVDYQVLLPLVLRDHS